MGAFTSLSRVNPTSRLIDNWGWVQHNSVSALKPLCNPVTFSLISFPCSFIHFLSSYYFHPIFSTILLSPLLVCLAGSNVWASQNRRSDDKCVNAEKHLAGWWCSTSSCLVLSYRVWILQRSYTGDFIRWSPHWSCKTRCCDIVFLQYM